MSATNKKPERFIPYRQFVGAFIPNCLLQYPDLTPMAKLTWGRLAQYAGKDGACYPSQNCLADALGTTPRHIRRVIRELEGYGFLEREAPDPKGRGQHKTTRYFFLHHPVFKAEQPLPPTDGGQPGEPNIPPISDSVPRDVHVPTLGTRESLAYGPTCPHPRDVHVPTLGTYTSHKEIPQEKKEKESCENNNHTLTVLEPEYQEPNQARGGSGGKPSSSLSQEQEKYIALKVAYQTERGKLDMPAAYQGKLERLALKGELSMADLPDLEAWDELRQAIGPEGMANLTKQGKRNYATALAWVKESEKAKEEEAEKWRATRETLQPMIEDKGAFEVALVLYWEVKDHPLSKALALVDQRIARDVVSNEYPDDYERARVYDWAAHHARIEHQAIEETKAKLTAYMYDYPEWTPQRLCEDTGQGGPNTFPVNEFGKYFSEAKEALFPELVTDVRIAWINRMRGNLGLGATGPIPKPATPRAAHG